MIQRIQTIFLILVVILLSSLFICSFVEVLGVEGIETLKVTHIWPLALLTAISLVIALVSIFMYNKRNLQMRVNIYNAIILLALQGYMVYYIYQIPENMNFSLLLPVVFPIISVLLSLLAARSILKDELIIRTMDRIR